MKTILLPLLILSLIQPVYARAAEPFSVSPDSIKTRLFEENTDLLLGLNRTQQTKEQLNISRAKLFPSLNIGGTITSGPSFILSSISFLLPFLFPSNWFNLRESEYLLESESVSYQVLKLNIYASALSVYLTVLNDLKLEAILKQQVANDEQNEQVIKLLVENGLRQQSDYNFAVAKTQTSRLQLSQYMDLINQEKASFRKMMALPLDTPIEFAESQIGVLPEESQTPQEVLSKISAISPEKRQLAYMVKAAKKAKWSQAFSFLGGFTLGSTGSGGENASFGNMRGSATVNLGFSYFPELRLSQLNIDQMLIRQQDLALENARLAETVLVTLRESKNQYDYALNAEQNYNRVYESEKLRYESGLTNLLNVIVASQSLLTARINRMKSELNLNIHRVSLQRMLLAEGFKDIGFCHFFTPSASIETDRKVSRATFEKCIKKHTPRKPTEVEPTRAASNRSRVGRR